MHIFHVTDMPLAQLGHMLRPCCFFIPNKFMFVFLFHDKLLWLRSNYGIALLKYARGSGKGVHTSIPSSWHHHPSPHSSIPFFIHLILHSFSFHPPPSSSSSSIRLLKLQPNPSKTPPKLFSGIKARNHWFSTRQGVNTPYGWYCHILKGDFLYL